MSNTVPWARDHPQSGRFAFYLDRSQKIATLTVVKLSVSALVVLAHVSVGCTGSSGSDSDRDDAGARGGAGGRMSDAGGHAAIGGAHAGAGGKPEADGGGPSSDADSGTPDLPKLAFSPYKDTSIDLNWNTNLITTKVSGEPVALANDMASVGANQITLAFATGECGSESWGGVPGATLAEVNMPALMDAGLEYILSTGGAAGSFSCGSDADMERFIARWDSARLVGVDFDIEAGQSEGVVRDLIARAAAAHAKHARLRFSLTIATLAVSEAGATAARSLGDKAQDSLSVHGKTALNAVKSVLGWQGDAASWPDYLTVNLMTMDYGSASANNCVLAAGSCDMAQSALQAAYNLHDFWGVPYSHIELTPMIGGNDVQDELFTLDDVDTVVQLARTLGVTGLHYWSYDRDRDCPRGSASPTCNSAGSAGTRSYLKRFLMALTH